MRPTGGRGVDLGRWGRAALAAIAATLFVAPGPASSQQRELTLERFDATIEVEPSGTIEVFEQMRFRFDGSWNGILRLIPIDYDLGPEGDHSIRLDVVDVRHVDGRALDYETDRRGAYLQVKVWVPGARDATHTVTLRYRVKRGLRFFETHDELYWNITGNGWDIPIRGASARVVLPEGATGRRARAFTGAYGSTAENARVQEIEEGYFFETTQPLGFREGLTVVVGWDPGVVHRPGPFERAMQAGLFLLLIPLVAAFGMWRLWSARGRDPEKRPVAPRYEPPEGMTPAEVGTLVDNSPDMRDFTATIVDLAVRGYLTIEEKKSGGLVGFFKGDEYLFHRTDKSSDDLKTHERKLLVALFGAETEVSTKELEHEFYKEIGSLKTAVFDLLVKRGDYPRRPDKVLATWGTLGVLTLVFGTGLLVSLAGGAGFNPLVGGVAGVGTGLAVLGFGLAMPARTVKGTRRLEEILGFQEFLDRVESDRFKRMIKGPEQFEAYLPYAMALGVEERWARAFDGIYEIEPTWYVGSHPGSFRPTLLVHNLDSMATRASSAMTSAPRSSSGSGFSGGGGGGGGFSGGGFGGGGGGGF